MKFLKFLPLLASASLLFNSCGPPPLAVDQQGQVSNPHRVSPQLLAQGNKEFQNYKRKYRISRNPAYKAQLDRVARRVTKVVNMPQAKWEFVVFENSTPNAFALPGGKIGVHSGLFQITKNDAGLATVVGHEIAHVTLNHANSRRNRAVGTAIGGLVLDQILRNNGASSGDRTAAAGVYGAASTLGLFLPYSRQQELQADRVGTIYMAQAGYDPREAVKLWKRFSTYKNKKNPNRTPEYLSTHPLDSKRIQALESFMPIALKQYRR